MAQVMVNFRMDGDLKKAMGQVADPFYAKANMERLEKAIADSKAGRNMAEHELIEEEQ